MASNGLERSCAPGAGDWIRAAPANPGLERAEAFFRGHGFEPHRHDTYALGMTLAGVQAFRYRGAARRSPADHLFVLHPDEVHDGRAGTEDGFRYRILYLDPRLVHAALGGGALPFVDQAVCRDRRLAAALHPALSVFDRALDDLEADGIVQDIADALDALDRGPVRRHLRHPDRRAVNTAIAYLDACIAERADAGDLEAVTGLSRYALARHFRAVCGTSPYRYLLMRRLEHARDLIAGGTPLAEAAGASGFADQSHMTRHFKQAYGLAPGRWLRLSGASSSPVRDERHR